MSLKIVSLILDFPQEASLFYKSRNIPELCYCTLHEEILPCPKIQTKRQATQHSCLHSFLGDGDKVIEIVYGDGEMGRLEQPKHKKISCTCTTSPTNQQRQDPLSFVLFESSFTSVSTVSRGHHPSLVSLAMPGYWLDLLPDLRGNCPPHAT